MVETTDSLCTLAPVACMLARLSTDSGRCFQRLDAVCWLLLDAPECGTSESSVAEMTALETSVNVRDIDRRVLLVHVAATLEKCSAV